jgi:hypothetical protein
MRLTEEKARHISHLIIDAIYFDDMADYDDKELVTAEVKKVLVEYLKHEDEIDSLVKSKIKSLSRNVPAGSREWDILYKKYFEQEMRKRNIF